jgi:ribonucleotide monophosphatase NagD (HAD superfamily)
MRSFKRKGKVAVLTNTGGASNSQITEEMSTDFDLIDAFLKSDMQRFKYISDKKYGDWYDGGTVSIGVKWI